MIMSNFILVTDQYSIRNFQVLLYGIKTRIDASHSNALFKQKSYHNFYRLLKYIADL